eukprot:2951619-Amphidinium_carterae.1
MGATPSSHLDALLPCCDGTNAPRAVWQVPVWPGAATQPLAPPTAGRAFEQGDRKSQWETNPAPSASTKTRPRLTFKTIGHYLSFFGFNLILSKSDLFVEVRGEPVLDPTDGCGFWGGFQRFGASWLQINNSLDEML